MEISDFRHTSLITFLLNTLERLVDWYIKAGTLSFRSFKDGQHFYRTGKSVESALLSVTVFIEAQLKYVGVFEFGTQMDPKPRWGCGLTFTDQNTSSVSVFVWRGKTPSFSWRCAEELSEVDQLRPPGCTPSLGEVEKKFNQSWVPGYAGWNRS